MSDSFRIIADSMLTRSESQNPSQNFGHIRSRAVTCCSRKTPAKHSEAVFYEDNKKSNNNNNNSNNNNNDRKHQESIRKSYCDRDPKDLHAAICTNPQEGA